MSNLEAITDTTDALNRIGVGRPKRLNTKEEAVVVQLYLEQLKRVKKLLAEWGAKHPKKVKLPPFTIRASAYTVAKSLRLNPRTVRRVLTKYGYTRAMSNLSEEKVLTIKSNFAPSLGMGPR